MSEETLTLKQRLARGKSRCGPFCRDPLLTVANTPRALFASIVLSWAAFGLLFAALEPDVEWFDGLYLGAVVQSTLGFGDVLPTEWLSKLLVMVYVWFCIYYLLPAAIFHVADKLVIIPDEFNDEDGDELKASLQESIANQHEILALLHNIRLSQAPYAGPPGLD